MSAPDAAPLPRLGEVFFDVRGNSRSMRLSWYADTDVAVFSIWQGGMCTGTFRLPMADLARMIEILQRGPDVRHEPGPGERGDPARRQERYTDAEGGYPGDYQDADYQDAGPRDAGYRDPGYRDTDYGSAEYGADEDAGRPYGGPAYGGPDPGYAEPGYAEPDYGERRYEPGYDQAPRGRRRAEWPDEGLYQQDATGQRSVPGDETGYGQQRFVPPYVQAQPDPSQSDYLDDADYRPPADPGGGPRHSGGRHSGGQPQ